MSNPPVELGPYESGLFAGFDLSAQLVDQLTERFSDASARAALGLVADVLRAAAAEVRAGRGRSSTN